MLSLHTGAHTRQWIVVGNVVSLHHAIMLPWSSELSKQWWIDWVDTRQATQRNAASFGVAIGNSNCTIVIWSNYTNFQFFFSKNASRQTRVMAYAITACAVRYTVEVRATDEHTLRPAWWNGLHVEQHDWRRFVRSWYTWWNAYERPTQPSKCQKTSKVLAHSSSLDWPLCVSAQLLTLDASCFRIGIFCACTTTELQRQNYLNVTISAPQPPMRRNGIARSLLYKYAEVQFEAIVWCTVFVHAHVEHDGLTATHHDTHTKHNIFGELLFLSHDRLAMINYLDVRGIFSAIMCQIRQQSTMLRQKRSLCVSIQGCEHQLNWYDGTDSTF